MEVGDGVLIDDAIDAIAFLLEFDPVAGGAEVVAEGGEARGGHAGEDACHGGGGGLDFWGGQHEQNEAVFKKNAHPATGGRPNGPAGGSLPASR